MLETEYKSIITREVYDRIKEHYKWDWIKHQINSYYVDEAGELGKRHTVVRVREKDGRFAVQVKAHKNPGEALQVCEETEFPADGAPEEFSAEDGYRFTGVKTGRLKKAGSLDTLRHSLMWNENTEICLDKSEYFDMCDYEVEVEYTGEMPAELMDELSSMGVEFKEKSVGKYTRFIRRLREIIALAKAEPTS